jgi:uroporphyrinogen decarboxylase
MTKRQRVIAALARKPVDRPPVAFWQHVPEVDHTARGLAEAMLAFHRRYDLDFIKNMPTGVYCVEDWGCRIAFAGAAHGSKQCVEHAVKAVSDWDRITPLDPGAGTLGRELEAVRLLVQGRSDGAPVLHTIFSPLTIARKLSGDRVLGDLRQDPEAVFPALEAIADTTARYAGASLEAGADGIFFAVQTAAPEACTEDEFTRFDLPYIRKVLDAVQGRSAFTLLHLHGKGVYFDRMRSLAAHAINWHDRLTPPSLAEAQPRFAGAVVGGLNEWGTLRTGPPGAVAAEVQDAIRQTGGTGLIVAPGCVLPLDVPPENLEVVVSTVRRIAASQN